MRTSVVTVGEFQIDDFRLQIEVPALPDAWFLNQNLQSAI